MGRLIDADNIFSWYVKAFSAEVVGNERKIKPDDVRFSMNDIRENLDNIPTVEAITKADYENRLKADMVAILTEIQLELDEMKITKVRSAGFAPYSKDPFRRGVNCSKEIIQQKIDSLKGVEDGNE